MKAIKLKFIKYEELSNGLHKFIHPNGVVWYSGKKAAKLMNLKNPSDAILRLVDDDNKKHFTKDMFDKVEYIANNAGEILINKNGLTQLLMYNNVLGREEKQELSYKLNLSEINDYKTYMGAEFIAKLKGILMELGVECIREYNIKNRYRIDLYIPKYKLAVEYDDSSHNSKKARINDLIRECKIKQILGCEFVRLNYKDTDYKNIAKVLSLLIDKRLKIERQKIGLSIEL